MMPKTCGGWVGGEAVEASSYLGKGPSDPEGVVVDMVREQSGGSENGGHWCLMYEQVCLLFIVLHGTFLGEH